VNWFTPSVEDAAREGSAAAWRQYAEDRRTTQARLRNQIHSTTSEGTSDPSDAVNRVPRLKALGNAIVPAVAHIFALAIYEQLVAMDGDVEEAA